MDQGGEFWWRHGIFYQIYPRSFQDSNADGVGDIKGIIDRLPYLVALGVDAIWLSPIFPSPMADFGYDISNYTGIDPLFGTMDNFDALIEAAHGRGLRVVLDGVFNHVGREFPLFRRAVAAGPHAPDAAWFHLSWPADRAPGQEPEYETFEGHRQLVALNHDEPAVARCVARVMNHWLERGADGWRLDAAYAVPGRFWTRRAERQREPAARLVLGRERQ